jgi:hypothetical protein
MCARVVSSRLRSAASSWARLVCISLPLVLLLVLQPRIAHGQTEKAQQPPSLMQQIESLHSKEQLLVQRLTDRSNQVSDLEESLKRAKQKSDDSAASSEALEKKLALAKELQYSSEMGLQATLSSLDQLNQTQQRSDAAFQAYRTEMQSQVAELQRERNTWSWIGWTGGGAALGAIAGAALGKDAGSSALGALVGAAVGAGGKLITVLLKR